MIETLFATVILTIGLVSLAALMSKMDLTTNDSRYISTAALLASEKMEQLAAYNSNDPRIQIVSGNSVGSLTTDTSQSIGGNTVSYYDEVAISTTNGAIAVTNVDAAGQYYTIAQNPQGGQPVQTTDTAPPAAQDRTLTFKRRWLIQNNIGGGMPPQVRRITVRVECPPGPSEVPFYQMSMVRNGQPN